MGRGGSEGGKRNVFFFLLSIFQNERDIRRVWVAVSGCESVRNDNKLVVVKEKQPSRDPNIPKKAILIDKKFAKRMDQLPGHSLNRDIGRFRREESAGEYILIWSKI